jgi:AcrR family transcriptional regulator
LVDAALAAFSEQGLDAPSLDAICERAGCTRGAFYVHFADRDALIAAAMHERRSRVLATLLGLGERGVTIGQVLGLFAAAVERKAFPVPGAVRSSELLAACRRSKAIAKTQKRLMAETERRLREQIQTDQRRGLVRSDVPAASLAGLLLLLEAGSELLLDLGADTDVARAATAFGALIAARA